MRTETHGETLFITDIPSLTADNSRLLKELAHARLTPEHRVVEVDLSAARILDSEGLGALISIHKTMCGQQGRVCLLNPTPFIEELVKLLRMDQLLPTVRR
jgi:anti-anti-sigma regulatory factor